MPDLRCPSQGIPPFGERHAVLVEKSIIGGGLRSNALCPICRSLDRDRLVYLYLTNRPYLFIGRNKTASYCPERNLSAWLRSKPELDYATADLAMDNVDFHIDLTKMPFPEFTFDAIICNHVLEQIPDDAQNCVLTRNSSIPQKWALANYHRQKHYSRDQVSDGI